MAERKAFNFYRSHWEQIKLLNKKQQLDILDSICKVQFLEININDIVFKDSISTLVWTGIKHSIETSLKGFASKQKGLGKELILPLSKGGSAPPYQEEKGEEEGEEEVKEQYIKNDFKECFTKWLLYKKEKKQSYKSEMSIESAYKNLIKLSGNDSKVAAEIIEQSIANNWAGLFELKQKANTSNNFIKLKNDSDY